MTMPKLQRNWTITRLKNVAEVNARSLSATTTPDFVLKYLEISNVNHNGIISEADIREIPFLDAPSRARRIVLDGDTVISSVRPNLQAVAYISQAADNLIASTGFYVVTPDRFWLNYKYLYYLLLSENTKQHLEAIAKGAGYPAVDDKDFVTLKLELPPLDEQRLLVTYLDKACAAIDAAIEAKHRQLETLDALRKSIIHKAVTSGLYDSTETKNSGVGWLGLIPKHWDVDRLKDVVNLRKIKTFERSEAEDYLELEDIEQGTGKIIRKRNTLEVESAVTLFKEGDVLFGKLRSYLEKYYLAEFDGKCTGEILAFEPTRIQGRFLFYCVASPWFIGQCNVLAYGAKMPRVNWPKQLAVINIPLPPADEELQIADYLEAKATEITKLTLNLVTQIKALEKYRKSLIHECVTGKRRITEEDIREIRVHV